MSSQLRFLLLLTLKQAAEPRPITGKAHFCFLETLPCHQETLPLLPVKPRRCYHEILPTSPASPAPPPVNPTPFTAPYCSSPTPARIEFVCWSHLPLKSEIQDENVICCVNQAVSLGGPEPGGKSRAPPPLLRVWFSSQIKVNVSKQKVKTWWDRQPLQHGNVTFVSPEATAKHQGERPEVT